MRKIFSSIIVLSFIGQLLMPAGFVFAQSQNNQSLDQYLSYFYNRYSRNFDEHGLVFKDPGYDVPDFRAPRSAREIISLALYYKYRALDSDKLAQAKIKQAVLDADKSLSSRPAYTQSFEDAIVQLGMINLINDFPLLFSAKEKDPIFQVIADRAEAGLLAGDTSNRAALSAAYWQAILNFLYSDNIISHDRYDQLSDLACKKIQSVAATDITPDGWYLEDTPKKFDPHYHMVSALAFLAYGELSGRQYFIDLSQKMTVNLRSLSFSNGMVEAKIGNRPVGLGAQFYLVLGLLSYRFGFKDANVYFTYASGNRFFSDPQFPDRLEYHSTISKTAPDYHDDIAFSNMGELALLVPGLQQIKINNNYGGKLTIPRLNKTANYFVTNEGNIIYFGKMIVKQAADKNHTQIFFSNK